MITNSTRIPMNISKEESIVQFRFHLQMEIFKSHIKAINCYIHQQKIMFDLKLKPG